MAELKKSLKEMFLEGRPVSCEKCNGKLYYMGSGKYRCNACELEFFDDFGKVKAFLEENGPASTMVISENTGVKPELINSFLRDGQLEIVENSHYYIKCEKCGCSIKYGHYCPQCSKEMLGGIMAIFQEETIEARPKSEKKDAKMHYLNKTAYGTTKSAEKPQKEYRR